MTKNECLNKLEEVSSQGLLSAIIFFRSPLSDMVEERHIWANSNSELIEWLSRILDKYNEIEKTSEFKIPYAAYLNNCLYRCEGTLFTLEELD